jgi:hypothetical protein
MQAGRKTPAPPPSHRQLLTFRARFVARRNIAQTQRRQFIPHAIDIEAQFPGGEPVAALGLAGNTALGFLQPR